MTRGDRIAYVILAVMFGGLIAWNYVDEPSRQLWQGHPELYVKTYFSSMAPKPPTPMPSCCDCSRCSHD